MSQTPLQTIIDPSSDAALNVYATNNQSVPVIQSATVTITNTTQYVTEIYNMKATAAGNVGELGFNDGNGFAADSGLTYNANTDSLTVGGTVFAGNLRTDNLQYANGTTYSLGGSSYGNGNVASYLPTYNGTITGATIVSSGNSNAATFNGSGAGLTNLPAANIVGNIPNATFATTAGTANSVAGANVTGTVANATHAITAATANSVAGANVTGTVSQATSATSATSATTAGTVTTAAQSNITSVGTLSGLTVSNSSGTVNFGTTSNVTLGAVGNLHISGGTTGQFLTTNGSGNLSWSTASSSTPNLQQVTTANATTDQAVIITNSTESIGFNTGALVVDGGVGIEGDVFTGGHVAARSAVLAGQYAAYSSFTVPKFIGRDAGSTYIQGALINTTETGSSDWVAYGDQSTDGEGWMDMGFTGTQFDDGAYTITKPGDGYLICQGLSDNTGGNLVIATGDLGGVTHRDIVFATGGFLLENERMRLNHEDNTLYVGAHGEANGTHVTNIDTNGNLIVGGDITVTGNIMPTGNVAKDIGSATNRFRDLYLSGTTIHLGGISISVDANTGNISMGNLVISGSGNVTGDSVSGQVANAAYADNAQNAQYAYAVNGANVTGQVANALVAGTVYTNAQPNITSVGTLNGLSAIGPVNLGSAANVTITGASANGQVLTSDTNGHLSWTTVSGTSSYGDSDVLTLLDSIVGNINISANAQLNVNGGASFNSAYVNGNITAGNVSAATFTGNLAGIVTTQAQPNITSVGTLASLAVTGNVGSGNVSVGGAVVFSDTSRQTTAYAGGQGHMMMIDTNRTDTYTALGTADRPFKTFAAAIAAAEAASGTAFTFVLMGCTVTENVAFGGTSFTSITIATSCRSVISGNITIDNNAPLSQLVVRNIEIGGTFTLTGDGTSEQMNSCSFYNVSFSGAVNITATNATAFYEVAFFGAVNFTNLSYLYINGAQVNEDWTITADDTSTYPIPSRGLNPGTGGSVSIVLSTIANNVYFVKGGAAAYVFQPHMTRLGRTTESYTIPSGWTVSAYGSDFRGTWTNNGTMGMKISGTDNRVKGTAPSYSSITGGDRVIADLVPTNSTGVEGDRAGMMAVGGGYIYVCTADWASPGSADIWTRTALTTGSW